MICKNLEQKLYRRSGTVIQLKITFCCCLVIAEIAWKLPYRNLFTMKKKMDPKYTGLQWVHNQKIFSEYVHMTPCVYVMRCAI